MPIHEYRCNSCGQSFELLIGSNSSSEEKRCIKCGSEDLQKIPSAAGFVLKSGSSGQTRCGKESTCCGSTNPCDVPSCEK